MPDELLDRLGTYFIHYSVLERYGITFGVFLDKYLAGTWTPYLA
ncbi:hypothetical protein [Paenibacillus bouchesdurhonensis]|nr:hypothetical protein [Paenibacillus bouchesdurhonensis]